jgi:hypothetical protein
VILNQKNETSARKGKVEKPDPVIAWRRTRFFEEYPALFDWFWGVCWVGGSVIFYFCFGTTKKESDSIIQITDSRKGEGGKKWRSRLLLVEGLNEEASAQLKLGFGLNSGRSRRRRYWHNE